VTHIFNNRVVLKQNWHLFFCLDFRCESASHHFCTVFFEMGSLEGFVVLKLPQYFLQRARKLAQNLLDSDSNLMRPPDTSPPPAPYLCHSRPPPSRRAFITLHSLALSRPSRCIASSLALIFVVSMVGRRGQRHRRIRRRRAGGGGRSHPSLSSSVATTTLHVARPPPTTHTVQHLLS
jgi:hypothetical protein